MVKVEVYFNRPNLIELQPNGLANDLRNALVVPSARAAEIPFRVGSKKILQLLLLILFYAERFKVSNRFSIR